MNNKIVVVADFTSQEVQGGSELYTTELCHALIKLGNDVSFVKSSELLPQKLNKDEVYIISNFKTMPELTKKKFVDEKFIYVILEHDFHFSKCNNPALYKNFILPEEDIINKDLYKNARVVFAQSKLHADIIRKNLCLQNVYNLNCNLWSDQELEMLRDRLNRKKTRKFGVMNSQNKNKGTEQTIKYCQKNNIKFELIPPCSQDKFYDELAKTETLVFLPTWVESFCRVAVEAKILGCKIITNKLLGCASSGLLEKSTAFENGEELLSFIQSQKWVIVPDILNGLLGNFDKLDKDWWVDENKPFLPKVSLISTTYNAEKFIDGFMKMFEEQTIKDRCELIIVDANSADKTKDIIRDYQKNNNNITLIEMDEKITTSKAFNIATERATGEFIAICLADDRLAPDYLEVMAKHLHNDPNVDLVYSDILQTTKPNETFLNNSSRGRLYEHSRMQFSPENMIKSLPGPCQMYRRTLHQKAGMWPEHLLHSCDWHMWLEAVRRGAVFKKINKPMALYLWNAGGLSTSQEFAQRRKKEERDTFYEFKDVIGQKNFETYKTYFDNIL